MSTMATARINTSQRMVLYRSFIIQEAYVTGKGNVWEWAHEDYCPPVFEVAGDCQTLFECIDAVDAWHANEDAQSEARADDERRRIELATGFQEEDFA
jgi:hypothetical protein